MSGQMGEDATLFTRARHIARLVIGGNSIAMTEEQKLKLKVKLDPSDHVRLNDDKTQAGTVTSAKLMREFDKLLARLTATVEVELMPGDHDMSDAFQPQQPLHPVLLPTAARLSSLRLVTNPFQFVAGDDGAEERASDGRARFFVTSGQNMNDVARETRYTDRLAAMEMVVRSGCACPTAPNTLFSYPFRDEDPFLFGALPHAFVVCDQPRFETRYAPLAALEADSCRHVTAAAAGAGGREREAAAKRSKLEEGAAPPGVRLVCVPSFQATGSVVLVDVHSPTLETSVVKLVGV
ncbi:DNA polymerase delta subunit 2 [Strigomonas culicis]|nr:DNA polymerase delta subunit 2 [Strigomonas culicis]|eukprot:EPY24742.1 DNA polymerase delta subunit 2 [Strigomonas culicis]